MKNFVLLSIFFFSLKSTCSEVSEKSCDSKIYCQGPILDYVQRAKLFPDSKTFVDMRLVLSPERTLRVFKEILKVSNNTPSKTQLSTFVDTYFAPGDEFDNWVPQDYTPDPKFLDKIENATVKAFAKHIVSIWPQLSRKVKLEVFGNPEKYSLIALPHGFIVPGGRFKETYYWDSYWILKGLLISDMTETVRGMLDNFLYLIKKYGFIPNGSRVYYLNRSQPPLFIPMVAAYIDKTNDLPWLKANMHLIEKEAYFWLENKLVNVTKNGVTYTLARYNSRSASPRPESYIEDITTASHFAKIEDQKKCYLQLKSGAETGWDFSSRWFSNDEETNDTSLSHIKTSHVIPVDLNAYLCGNFKMLQDFYDKVGFSENAKYWHEKHEQWKLAIDKVLFDEEDGVWYDFDLQQKQSRKEFYPSNLAPLWAKAIDPAQASNLGDRAVEYLLAQKIERFEGGVPTSLEMTGQQWDFPNAWPPLQSIVVFGLENSGSDKAKQLARKLAGNYLNAVHIGYQETGALFEKYDAENVGHYGGGGEYNVQTGFGWTNGAFLEFLDYYGEGVFTERSEDD